MPLLKSTESAYDGFEPDCKIPWDLQLNGSFAQSLAHLGYNRVFRTWQCSFSNIFQRGAKAILSLLPPLPHVFMPVNIILQRRGSPKQIKKQ